MTLSRSLESFRNGKFVICRRRRRPRKRGDLIIAAEKVTPAHVNFMVTNARGELCAPLTIKRCHELNLPHQSKTTRRCSAPLHRHSRQTARLHNRRQRPRPSSNNKRSRRSDIDPRYVRPPGPRPSALCPERGVLRRAGHTEAAIDLARLAGMQPAAALIEILNEDGTMARLPPASQKGRPNGA